MFQGLSTAISGLYTNKKALDTVSHNISNSSNPNYVRQDVTQSETGYQKLSGIGEIGSGVKVSEIRQIRDRFLDTRYRDEAGNAGYWDGLSNVFSQVEEIMNEPGGSGLSEVMDQLWNSFDELAKDPENLTVRGMVRERAIAFVETVNHTSNQLNSLQKNLNKDIRNKVGTINKRAEEIARLNSAITSSESSGIRANDLRDKRNALIDSLSEDIEIRAIEKSDGGVDLYIDGIMLVSGEETREIEVELGEDSFFQLKWQGMDKSEIQVKGGYLKGIIEGRRDAIPSIKDKLDKFVNNLAGRINEVHREGTTLLGDDGEDFFVFSPEIGLNHNLDTLNNIAASESGSRGDGEIAKRIRDIRDENFDNSYRSIITDLGVEANKAKIMKKTHSTILSNIANQKSSVSGVSMDEEMANMLKFQHSYTANSRVINAIDEMIENIVNRMGRVGN